VAWDFSTDPDFQRDLDWVGDLVRDDIEPLEVLASRPLSSTAPSRR